MNYEKLGLKSGIEIHQQLDTNKLFCSCPSILRKDPGKIVQRKMNIAKGEQGDIDEAVKFEATRDRIFEYEYYDTNCLVELDESPPELINQEALKIALEIALLLNCKILQNSQIMRKTVIDGSNTSGFQRTILIARNGYIETEQGKVGIQTVMLEEDAARIISQEKNKVKYRLDRLGIPLVEIATAPDIKTPEQAKETALHIGEILRACKVKRGLGTIRQDVNMSIKNSSRIEIKGVQNPDLIAKVIKSEIKRQEQLVKKKKSKPEVRKALVSGETEFLRPLPGSARMYPETDLPLLKMKKQFIDKIRSNLPRLRKELREELKKKGLKDNLIQLLIKDNIVDEFQALLKIYNKPEFVAKVMTIYRRDIKTKTKKQLTIDQIENLLHEIKKNNLHPRDIREAMIEIAKGKSIKESVKKEKVGKAELEEEIVKIIKSKPNLSEKAYMGLIMGKYKGKVSGKEISDILKKHVK